MKTPLFINSWIKLTAWIAYTTVVVLALMVAALYLSPIVWLVAPFLFLLGYGLQSYLIHKNILTPKNTRPANAIEQPPISPEIINQDVYNLCGPAALLYALAYALPKESMEFVSKFEQNPREVGLSLPTRIDDRLGDLPVDLAIMMAMKHRFNYTGYHPIAGWIEQIQGATLPKEMVNWIHFFEDRLNLTDNLNSIVETFELRNTDGHSLSHIHQALLGGVYSKKHYTPENFEEHVDYLLKWSQSSASIIMLMDINLCLKIMGDNSANMTSSLAGVEFSHYVYLHNMSFNKTNNTVTIKIFTWGVCAERNLSIVDFQAGFRGFLAWQSVPKPNTSPPVSDETSRYRACQRMRDDSLPHASNPYSLFSFGQTQEAPVLSSRANEAFQAMMPGSF